jgi:hypothetical protein
MILKTLILAFTCSAGIRFDNFLFPKFKPEMHFHKYQNKKFKFEELEY